MADEPFIDTHIHFWDHSIEGLEWAWLKTGFTFRRWEGSDELDAPRYTPPEFQAEAVGCELAGAVHVHCAHPIDDGCPRVPVRRGSGGLPLERTPAGLAEWSAAMARRARRPNVVCKISAV